MNDSAGVPRGEGGAFLPARPERDRGRERYCCLMQMEFRENKFFPMRKVVPEGDVPSTSLRRTLEHFIFGGRR